jgi:outer membrane protein TolC
VIAARLAAAAVIAPQGLRAQERRTLDECIAIAEAEHPSLRSADASVVAANRRVWQATSGYLPHVNGSYSVERRKTVSVGNDFNIDTAPDQPQRGNSARTFTRHDAGVSFSQVLFDFGRNLAAIRAAQATERSLQADRATQLETVVFNVKQAYFNLLAARRLLVVADDTERQTRKQLEDAQGRLDVGLAPRFDVTRAQVQLANAELNRLSAGNSVALAGETLRNALGLDGPLDFDIVDTLDTAPVSVTEESAVAAAYARRPELESLREQQRAAEEQIASLQRDYLPNLTGGGGYFWSGTDYPERDNWNIGASVNVPVFNGGLTIAQVGEAKANLARLQFDEQTLRQSVALEVRQSVLNLRQAAESIAVAQKGAQQARENLALAEGRYQTGVGNIIELTDARTVLTTADAEHVRSLYDYRISLATLERAMGGPIAAAAEGGTG